MEPLKLIGKIKRINDVQQITETFKKKEFVVETQENYPQTIAFELVNDKVSLIDPFAIGDTLEVSFNVRGREWQKNPESEVRVFISLSAWRIQKIETTQAHAESEHVESAASESDDELPF